MKTVSFEKGKDALSTERPERALRKWQNENELVKPLKPFRKLHFAQQYLCHGLAKVTSCTDFLWFITMMSDSILENYKKTSTLPAPKHRAGPHVCSTGL